MKLKLWDNKSFVITFKNFRCWKNQLSKTISHIGIALYCLCQVHVFRKVSARVILPLVSTQLKYHEKNLHLTLRCCSILLTLSSSPSISSGLEVFTVDSSWFTPPKVLVCGPYMFTTLLTVITVPNNKQKLMFY